MGSRHQDPSEHLQTEHLGKGVPRAQAGSTCGGFRTTKAWGTCQMPAVAQGGACVNGVGGFHSQVRIEMRDQK